MKLTLADTKFLKDSVAVIADLVSEVRFTVSSDGLELVAMDPANVAMVVYKLLSSSFVEYDPKGAGTLAINLNDLKQVLRRVKPSDTVTLENPEGKLKVTLKGASKRQFLLPLIEVEDREQKVPKLSFDATITTNTGVFNDAIEDADIVGESVAFHATSAGFIVTARSDLQQADVEILPDANTTIEATGETRSKYSIEYLKKMIQGGKLADKVSIKFGKDYPLQLDYTVKDRMQLMFILAPRVDND